MATQQDNAYQAFDLTFQEWKDYFRSWFHPHPHRDDLPPIEAADNDHCIYTVVPHGYESPYLFGRELRKLVGDDDAVVSSVTLEGGGDIYYCHARGKLALFTPRAGG